MQQTEFVMLELIISHVGTCLWLLVNNLETTLEIENFFFRFGY